MEKGFVIILSFILPPILVFMFWYFFGSLFMEWQMAIYTGIPIGIIFSLVDYFFIDKKKRKYKFLIRLFMLLFIFVLSTTIYDLLIFGEFKSLLILG